MDEDKARLENEAKHKDKILASHTKDEAFAITNYLEDSGYELKHPAYVRSALQMGTLTMAKEIDRLQRKIMAIQQLYHENKLNPEIAKILFK